MHRQLDQINTECSKYLDVRRRPINKSKLNFDTNTNLQEVNRLKIKTARVFLSRRWRVNRARAAALAIGVLRLEHLVYRFNRGCNWLATGINRRLRSLPNMFSPWILFHTSVKSPKHNRKVGVYKPRSAFVNFTLQHNHLYSIGFTECVFKSLYLYINIQYVYVTRVQRGKYSQE